MIKNKYLRGVLFYICGLIALSSCISNKTLMYVQNANFSKDRITEIDNLPTMYKTQPGDILLIHIKDVKGIPIPEFTLQNNSTVNLQLNMNSEPNIYVNGYSIDTLGYIVLPTVGKTRVKGMTMLEIEEKIKNLLVDYIKNPIIDVKLGNYKVSILGEVRSPNRYFIFNSRISIFEGLAMAGDLKDFADRKNVKLIRQTEKGTKTIILDLTDPNLMKSPYYFLLPNDIMIVSPSNTQIKRNNLPILTTVFAAISSLVLVLRFFGY
jgi:polysaccharide export outer membrane protein